MTFQQAISRTGVPIRLTDERWQHIIEEHAELSALRSDVLSAISNAERVLSGAGGELLAIRTMEPGKALVAVYRETAMDDGFLITAFVTRRLQSLDRREQLWPSPT
jgi:chromosome condensin MukBEF complex kleisin-like MukF subunit